ncbi:hypothetical protein, conserved [Eimeria tenella]|uniref:Uncharacterized protein n=1 Tax=Eimeria tenella TaxID=5802 RepID=U6KXB6_EIMTE|nr:hypothetical protein, conserved [Eimeria tenella]CDJ41573.1 hypothetical protein, conserved [Eimeria tenella]|eukprot:XP_013232323.1 hypothetical protein, conserved [Eimeria tenella]
MSAQPEVKEVLRRGDAEGDGETLQSVELTRGNDHKKHHTKKPSYADGSPITASGKKKTETARGDAEGSAAAATDVQLPSDTKKKKKGKKKTVSGAVENADSIENAESHHQTSGSSRTRKPTLLLCDNAAAVALGNLVAIQRHASTRADGAEDMDGGQWIEEVEDEETEQILAKAETSARRIGELRAEMSTFATKPLDSYFNEFASVTQGKALKVGLADEEEVIAVEQKEAQANIAACVARQHELQEQQQRLLICEQVVRKRTLDELEKREAKLKVLKRQAEKHDIARQDHLVKLVRECECKMEALMGRRKGRLSAVYGLLKKEGEYTAVAVEQDDAKAKERADFIPLGGTRLRWSVLHTIEQKLQETNDARRRSSLAFTTSANRDKDFLETANDDIPGAAAVTKPVEFAANFNDECLRQGLYRSPFCITLLKPIDVPLLRGPVDPSVRRYFDMDQLIRTNLDSWLCNLYFRCQLLPQYTRGQVEFELQLEHAATLLGGKTKESLSSKSQQHHSVWGTDERAKAEDLVQQLVSALQACEELAESNEEACPAAIVTKDGVRAWRHRDSPSALYSIPDVHALQEYSYSVYCGTTLSHPSEASRKLKYLKSSLLDDFQPSLDKHEIGTMISALICAILALWCCSLLFSLGVWLYLRVAKVPVYNIEFSAFYVRLDFVQELLSLGQIICISVAGPAASLAAFVIASVVVYMANGTVGRQPNPVYQFLSALGAATALSPALMALIEGVKGESLGISFMLSNYYIRDVHNATLGVIISLLIDLASIGLGTIVRRASFLSFRQAASEPNGPDVNGPEL